ncbi:MAG: CubicO group peptidase (beta-lactamase class C family) [Paraglaciecola sp.]|jgi:CubicO group peptidase (beta-lactamase class C family)
MNTKFFSKLSTTLLLAATLSACGGGSKPPPSVEPPAEVDLEQAFEQIREGHNVPALAGAFVRDGEVTQSGVVGVRSLPDGLTATIEDQWHLGSLTKSMTATLAARLVEQGILQWTTTIDEVLPQLAANINPAYKDVTIRELLSSTGGIISDISRLPGWSNYFGRNDDIQAVRREMVEEILHFSPENERGKFNYSNAGFVVAATMLEALTLEDWETLIQNEVFLPLSIEDAGFGAPGDGVNQPTGHKWQNNQWQAVDPSDPGGDNPKAMGPAGIVHMSLASLAKYTQAHLQGESGESDLLSAESFITLHQVQPGTNYALGWFNDGESISHDGSNTFWYAKIGLDIQRGIAAIAVTNAGNDDANVALDDAIKAMLSRN